MKLTQLGAGQTATITGFGDLQGEDSIRLLSLGMAHGASVQVVSRAPLGGPIAVRVGTRCIALRRHTACQLDTDLG